VLHCFTLCTRCREKTPGQASSGAVPGDAGPTGTTPAPWRSAVGRAAACPAVPDRVPPVARRPNRGHSSRSHHGSSTQDHRIRCVPVLLGADRRLGAPCMPPL
jgi:hypothetical protein